jgi:autotransporter-associated beta strand protein
MRWILPVLVLALVPSAFGEIAVYTGALSVQNVSIPGVSSLVRVADVIDLSSGKIVTIGLSGGRTDLSYALGPEVQYVVAKTNDGHSHGVTAFAQASMDTDSAGSKFAMAANLRGRDTTVSLADGSTSQWPRTLVGSGSLVAAAGTDAATAPASVSFSSITLSLNDSLSKMANASGGNLTQAAEVIAQHYRNRVAALLHLTPTNASVVNGSTSTGLTKTGAGTLLFGSTSNTFVGAVTLNGGTLRLNPTGSINATLVDPTTGASILLNGGNQFSGGATTTVTGANLLLNNGAQTSIGATTIGSGTLTLNGGNQFTSNATFTGGGSIMNSVSLDLTGVNAIGSQTGVLNIGSVSGSVLTLNSNSLLLSSIHPTLTIGSNGALISSTLNSNGVLTVQPNLTTSNLSLTSATLNAGATLNVTGATGLTRIGTGTLVLAPPAGSTATLTGITTVPATTTPVTSDPVAANP